MNTKDFEQMQYEQSAQAGMSQRYHQFLERKWNRLDSVFRIVVGVLTVASALLSIVTFYDTAVYWALSSICVSCGAAFLAVLLNVVPFLDWRIRHADLFRRWTSLREDVDSLKFDGEWPTEAVIARLREVERRSHQIGAEEPAPNTELLEKCFREEEESRQYSESAV